MTDIRNKDIKYFLNNFFKLLLSFLFIQFNSSKTIKKHVFIITFKYTNHVFNLSFFLF